MATATNEPSTQPSKPVEKPAEEPNKDQPADKRVVRDGVKNPDGQQSPPSGAYTTPEVFDGFQLDKPEYEYDEQRHTLEVNREHPNHIYENQQTQQAQENTVKVQNGEIDKDGKKPEN